MPVTIEDVLGLLPELFPGIQQVPLANISQLPDNPGGTPSEEVILGLMESIRENDLQNPLKLKPNRTQPLAEGVQIHPENPRITLEGRPWRVEDFHYWVFSGNRRLIALNRLQKDKAPCYITNPSELETVVKGRIDNVVDQRGWWVDYQDVERVIKANPYVTQRQIKGYLGLDDEKINRAIKVLPLLNSQSRDLIARDTSILNKGIPGISDLAISQLAALGPGTGLKPGRPKKDMAEGEEPQKLYPYPPIPPETQDLVYRALQVALAHKMTENQLKGLVAHIQAGGQPEDYKLVVKPSKKKGPPKGGSGPGGGPGSGPGGSGGSGGGGLTPSIETPKVADSSQLTVDSKTTTGNPQNPQPNPTAPTVTIPVVTPTPQKSGFWNALKKVWQGFIGAVLKAFFASGPRPQVEGQGLIAPGSKTDPGEVSFFWGTMAGIPWIKAIRAKIKSGQDLTLWEKLFLVAAFFGRILHWTWHKTWPRTKWFFGLVWQYMKIGLNATLRFLGEVVGKPAKKVIQGVVGIALVLGLAYGLYLFFFHPAGLRGLVGRATSGVIHWVGSWVNPWEGDSKSIPQPQPTTIPTPGPKPPVSDQALAVPISKPDMGTPGPKPPVSDQALAVPISKPDMGTPGPKPPVSDQALAVPISKSDMGTPGPKPPVSDQALAVPISKPDMGTPGPKPPVSDQALAVPISKPDMGTPGPTPEVVKTKHLKLKTSKSLKKAVPVAVVSNQNPTPKTENTAASSALPVAPATGQEAAWVAELIPAFPSPFLVKPLDLQPDPTISPLMVQKRLSEIQDPERFRVYVGHDRQTIKSMNVDDGGMDLFFNGSFGGLLGDSSSFRFFWEDVQGIRLATVEVSGDKPQTLCFCALEVKTKKKMAAFECDPGDVAHLVSALAAQFKSSTKREVLVAPLPYLNQGLWLGGQNQVDGMWKESPAGRSQEVKLRFTPADWQRPTTGGGIRLGDYLWGLGVNLNEQTGKEELFRQLGGMASGPATLFVVGPEDWRKAQNAETGPENDPFNPPRRAVRLPTP